MTKWRDLGDPTLWFAEIYNKTNWVFSSDSYFTRRSIFWSKFEVSSRMLISFRQRGVILPPPIGKWTPQKPTQIRANTSLWKIQWHFITFIHSYILLHSYRQYISVMGWFCGSLTFEGFLWSLHKKLTIFFGKRDSNVLKPNK